MLIKRQEQTVWLAANGATELLIEKSPGHFYVPLGHLETPGLVELGLAIADALARSTTHPDAPTTSARLARAVEAVRANPLTQ